MQNTAGEQRRAFRPCCRPDTEAAEGAAAAAAARSICEGKISEGTVKGTRRPDSEWGEVERIGQRAGVWRRGWKQVCEGQV